MVADIKPRVYADADVFLHVLLDQEHAEICGKLLAAAERGDVQLVASRLLLVEIAAYKGDRPGREPAEKLVERFLDTTGAQWVELDVVASREAVRLSWEHKLRGADAVHLATAIRRSADYFMSYDKAFPYGTTVDGTRVLRPEIVWQPTLEDTAA
ncbi:PIN domain-containing protein [Microbacterium sp. Marseille-Q6648]|uniref:type II toxin-antitoxin system VapC family toxin n=1 Tax=Microbacterium sp. Marseille-Q6648 TaxID=2937991 RepID=UPI00203D8A04|nr:PIN domain-containing protein [Microbacterium sp. Marseille-Q6648]